MPTKSKTPSVVRPVGKATVTYKLLLEVGCACKSTPLQTRENLAVAMCPECERITTTVVVVESERLLDVISDAEEMCKDATDPTRRR